MIIFSAIIGALCILIAVNDWRDRKIPNVLVFLLLIAVILQILISDVELSSHAMGGLMAFVWFGALYMISKGRWVGGGDVKLSLPLGLYFGGPLILIVLLISYACGAIHGVYLLVRHKARLSKRLPMGTYLCVSSIALILLPYISQLVRILFEAGK